MGPAATSASFPRPEEQEQTTATKSGRSGAMSAVYPESVRPGKPPARSASTRRTSAAWASRP